MGTLIFLDKRSCNATRLPLDWYERPDFLFKCLWKYGRRPAGQHRWTVYWSRVISHFPHSSCWVWNLLSWTSLLLLLLSPLFKNRSTDIRTETFRGTRSQSGQVSQEALTALLEFLFNWKHSASHVGSWVIFSLGDHNAANQKSLRRWGAQTSDSEQYMSLWSCAVFITVRVLIVLYSHSHSFHLLSSVVFVFADLSLCTYMCLCDNALGLESRRDRDGGRGEQVCVHQGVWGKVPVTGSWGDISRQGTTGRWNVPGHLESVLLWLIFHLFSPECSLFLL